jgi:hypothetical protein
LTTKDYRNCEISYSPFILPKPNLDIPSSGLWEMCECRPRHLQALWESSALWNFSIERHLPQPRLPTNSAGEPVFQTVATSELDETPVLHANAAKNLLNDPILIVLGICFEAEGNKALRTLVTLLRQERAYALRAQDTAYRLSGPFRSCDESEWK